MLEEHLGRHLNFLVIDSDQESFDLAKDLIGGGESYPGKIKFASNYGEALEILNRDDKEFNIDICILEYFFNNEEANGIEMMEGFMEAGHHIPYIFLVKEVDPELYGEVMERGATKCFFKGNSSYQMLWMSIKKLYLSQ